jgi:hypothetical protein
MCQRPTGRQQLDLFCCWLENPTNIATIAALSLQLLKFYTAAQDDAYFEGMGCYSEN